MNQIACKNCTFWVRDFEWADGTERPTGRCHRHPPPWGDTREDEWCGEFKAAVGGIKDGQEA